MARTMHVGRRDRTPGDKLFCVMVLAWIWRCIAECPVRNDQNQLNFHVLPKINQEVCE